MLGTVVIEVPPLRAHKSDIPILADVFVRASAQAMQKHIRGIDSDALAELMRYEWPGNVRELQDMMEHAVASSSGPAVGSQDLPALPDTGSSSGSGPGIPGATIHEIEKDAILRTLDSTGGSTSKAARILEMSVRKIQYKLKEYRAEAAARAAVERMPAVARPKAQRKPVASRTLSR